MSSAEHIAEPIAILGIGSRFPGAPDGEALWRALVEGLECTGEYPGGRTPELDALYERAGTAGAPPVRRGGFLPECDRFDAGFFEISRREAEWMDPQQRLLLEVAWEALEDAGLPLERVRGSRTGVFVGIWTNEYEAHANAHANGADFFHLTGGPLYGAPGRIAYQFDLRGPDVSVNAASVASLAAVHLAVVSLRAGECAMALAGGVNLILRPEVMEAYGQAGMLAPDGRCKFGDAGADGIVRSEGAGMLVLKRFGDAERDADRIAAVILGTAMGNSGRCGGSLTTPSEAGERQVMLDALAQAGVDPVSVEYVEAHGTGSRAGDPVELAALAAVYGRAGRRRAPCPVGSVKSNLGHAESAAGVAGLIKTVEALRHGTVPATLHVRKANPAVDWETAGIVLARESAAWPRPAEGRRRAAVNGLALTGTNVHLVLQEAPEAVRVETPERSAWVIPVTAASEAALRSRAGQMAMVLAENAPVGDVCWTAAVQRSALAHRVAVTGRDTAELQERLQRFAAGEPGRGTAAGVADRARKVAFVFSGNGSQWIGMGRELLRLEPVFREAMESCDAEIQRQAGWSVLQQLADDGADDGKGGRWTRTEVIQPLLFAEGVALAVLWKSWGVRPAAVVGHSMGEVAAAHVIGILTLADAVTVICRRSALMQRVAGQGAMAVLDLPEAEAGAALVGLEGRVVIAGSNSPRSVLLSGDPEAVARVVERMEALGVYCRRVKFDVASHSPQMDPLQEELRLALAGVRPQASTVPLFSTVTGAQIEGTAMDAGYWARNLREPVWFARTVAKMAEAGCDAFVEISPHPVLAPFVEQTADVVAVGSTRRGESEAEAMLASLGRLWAAGGAVAWSGVYPAGNRVILPAYPWQRERYWIEAREGAPPQERAAAAAARPAEPATTKAHRFAGRWQAMPAGERGPALTRWVREQVAAVLQARVEEISDDRALKAQGLTSLMTLELQNLVQRGLGITLSAGTAWNYPTVAALAGYLKERIEAPLANGTVKEAESGPGTSAQETKKVERNRQGLSAAELLEAELAGASVLLNKMP